MLRPVLIHKKNYLVILFAVLFLHGPQLFSQGFLRASGKRIVNEQGENVLLRGMGLGGWMLQEGYMLHIHNESQQHRIRERLEEMTSPAEVKEFYDTWLENHMRRIDVDSMKSWGFNSVRLPMHFNLYTLPVEKEPVAGKNTWLEKGFAMTDSLIAWCKANNMYVILDLHAAPGGQGNDLNISDRDSSLPSLWQSEANQQKTIALWKKLAERYVHEPAVGGYDIINEPNWGFTDSIHDQHGQREQLNEPLKKLMVAITKAIREVDNKHIIIIEGNAWGNNYNGILPAWDKNMVLSFHKYWNRNTTKEIQKMLDARNQYNVPVWIGETGENSNVWYTEAVTLFEKDNIGWSWWPLKKLGANNPLEIRPNLNYMRVADYLNGEGKQPKESDVYSGLLELATYAKLENCIYHRDVIDAMFRQVHSSDAVPFRKNEISNHTVIRAVDYDLGRNGSAYYDLDTANYSAPGLDNVGNRGHTYRNDGVDIRKDSSKHEKYYVNHIEKGEWMQYTLQADKPGTYTLGLMVTNPTGKGRITVLLNGKAVATNVSLPTTPDNETWKTLYIRDLKLGRMDKLRLVAETGGYELAQLQFEK